MASAAITTRPPSSAEIARATAAAIPSEISTRPLVGILGVLIGAGLPVRGSTALITLRSCLSAHLVFTSEVYSDHAASFYLQQAFLLQPAPSCRSYIAIVFWLRR